MTKGNICDEVKKLLDMADSTNNHEEATRLANKVLELDPTNCEALLLLADNAISDGDMENNRFYLNRIIENYEKGQSKDNTRDAEDANDEIYLFALERLAFSLSFDDRHEEAMSVAQKLLEIDAEGKTTAKDTIYRSLLMMDRYKEILEMICQEENPSAVALHAKAIALYQLDGMSWNSYEALVSALEGDPDAPFYALGIWDEPEEPDEEEVQSMLTALYIVEPWAKSDELIDWITHITIAFGFFTQRLPEDFLQVMELSETGSMARQELDELKKIIDEMQKVEAVRDHDFKGIDRVVFDALRFRRKY